MLDECVDFTVMARMQKAESPVPVASRCAGKSGDGLLDRNRFAHSGMKRSTAVWGAFAILVGCRCWRISGIVLDGPLAGMPDGMGYFLPVLREPDRGPRLYSGPFCG
jgi:hypothetical protein